MLGLFAFISQERPGQIDGLDLAEPSLGLGPDPAGQQVCFEEGPAAADASAFAAALAVRLEPDSRAPARRAFLIQAREHPGVYLEDRAAQADLTRMWKVTRMNL